jgi:ABC-type Fe3+ transport system substrate-binding protein
MKTADRRQAKGQSRKNFSCRRVVLLVCNKTLFLLAAVCLALPLRIGAAPAASSWEDLLEAANRESQVVIYGSGYYGEVFQEFQKKFSKIRVQYESGGGASQFAVRLMNERRAGKYLWDLYLGGIVTPYKVFYDSRILEPIKPALLLPEVLDESKWWEGRHHYADPEGNYIFVFQGDVHGGENAYNVKLVDPREFKSYRDFLAQKWKGKVVAYDPKSVSTVAHSLRFFYNSPELGPDFIRRFFGEMELTLSRDQRQMLDWLAAGKFPIAFFISGVEEAGKQQGLPVKMFDPNRFSEGAFVGPTQGSAALFNRAPHPNAAKVALNWLLSREGQIAYQTVYAKRSEANESMREDIPKDLLPPSSRRVKGGKYTYSGRPEWVDMGPVNEVVNEALQKRKR